MIEQIKWHILVRRATKLNSETQGKFPRGSDIFAEIQTTDRSYPGEKGVSRWCQGGSRGNSMCQGLEVRENNGL